jgi:hypothetical protein
MPLNICLCVAGKPLLRQADGVPVGDPLVEPKCLLIVGLGGGLVGAGAGDVAKAYDAPGLAKRLPACS